MHPELEFIQDQRPGGPFQAALFDFDGTLSLLRQNWQEVMVPMMVAELCEAAPPADPRDAAEVEQLVWDFVTQLTGKQTIYQMIRLAEEVRARGGIPQDPLLYKRRYHDLLWTQVERRIAAVAGGTASRESMMVRGSETLLEALLEQGCTLYLASGTDLDYVRNELAVLGLDRFFGDRVYGALDDYRKFSKALVIQRIIQEAGVPGPRILGVGDGYVEIEEVAKVGGFALGVASHEDGTEGVNPWKRRRLIQAGAHAVAPHYQHCRQWLPAILPAAP